MTEQEKSINLFKYFIDFLQIWGQENYGSSAEVDWCKALAECQKFHLFDFNEKLEKVIYAESDEEFRDLAFKWVENKVLDGWPIWRMFKMSDWLTSKLEEENTQLALEEQKKVYNSVKCYRCKYFRDHASWFKDVPLQGGYTTVSVEEELPEEGARITYRDECLKRNQLIEEAKDAKTLRSWSGDPVLKYKKFNEDLTARSRKWKPVPEKLTDCPYFKEGGMDWPTYVLHTFGINIKA